MRGEAYDPTAAQSNEMRQWTEQLLVNMGLSPSWSFRFGRNQLIQTIDVPKKSTQLVLPAAFLLAGALGLILNFVVTGFGLGMRHLELTLQAEKLGMLDRDVLRGQ